MLFITTLLFFMYAQFSDNAVVKDFFYLNNDNWKIVGNKNITDAIFRPFSMNGLLSNYIVGDDRLINVDHKNKNDANLWYFSKNFSTQVSLANTSIFSFTMASLVGDFRKLNYENSVSSALIKIMNNVTNERIIFPVSHLIEKYNGSLRSFVIPMVHSLWLNGLNYTQIGVNHFKNVLKNVTQIDILGDWTQGNETMCLDNVLIG